MSGAVLNAGRSSNVFRSPTVQLMEDNDRPIPRVVSLSQLAEWLGKDNATLVRWIKYGWLPPPVASIGGERKSERYWEAEVIREWWDEQRQQALSSDSSSD